MKISWVQLVGFRNFLNSKINFEEKTLVLGANDVGKTNLLHAIRILLDRSLSENDIEPLETDFHIKSNGEQVEKIEIMIAFSEITEDAVLSRLKGWVSNDGETYIKYEAYLNELTYKLYIGFEVNTLTEIDSRSYLKYIHFKYLQGTRDLARFIRTEKRQLLKLAKDNREINSLGSDNAKELKIQKKVEKVNQDVQSLSYVSEATASLNKELKKISYHQANYEVKFEARAINFSTFIDQLDLTASTRERNIGLGGDGRNNQVLMALWKTESQREHDIGNEVILYCIEEPEVHLHPHQQRKLAKYLIEELPGQVFVSTHSPQITQAFQPDKIVRLLKTKDGTKAANEGCSNFIEKAWRKMGYRMSIIPAESFFADVVFLVEGPSEVLFYNHLAKKLNIDLDFYNISILSVDGIAFTVFVKILNVLEIPWVMRTDNDIFKLPKSKPSQWRMAGLNRALKIAERKLYDNLDEEVTDALRFKLWQETSIIINRELSANLRESGQE